MTSTPQAAELLLRRIGEESGKYNLKLNHTKCIHLRMNDIHRVHYQDGNPMPLSDDATYLGGKIYNNGDYRK